MLPWRCAAHKCYYLQVSYEVGIITKETTGFSIQNVHFQKAPTHHHSIRKIEKFSRWHNLARRFT